VKKQPHEERGWVKGLSMWPNLIPGDILKAREIPVAELEAGMIVVFPGTDRENPVVHRVLSIQNTNNELVIKSGGDRSGPDEAQWNFAPTDRIRMVTGVLRRGHYGRISSVSIPAVLSPSLLVRVYCGLVRRLFW